MCALALGPDGMSVRGHENANVNRFQPKSLLQDHRLSQFSMFLP